MTHDVAITKASVPYTVLRAIQGLITPDLLTFLVNTRLPYPKHGPINFSDFGRDIFLADPFGPLVRARVWPVLQALSRIGPDRMPSLMVYLPPPHDPTFPEQCLGLHLLVDHCPRLLCRGVDHRWTYGYFSLLSEQLAQTWQRLPARSRPGAWERWRGEVGLDYWIAVRFWLGTPFVHSQKLDFQEKALAFTEETRVMVEEMTGTRDPYRGERDAILSDLYGFGKIYTKGPPQGEDVTAARWTFWMGMLMDVHKPVVDKFGRYPYLNAILGRDSTEEEDDWLEKTDHFGEATKEVADKIRDDVEQGTWRPFGEESLDSWAISMEFSW